MATSPDPPTRTLPVTGARSTVERHSGDAPAPSRAGSGGTLAVRLLPARALDAAAERGA